MIRKKKNESSAQFTARLAQARKVTVDPARVEYVMEALTKDDPVKAVKTLIRSLELALTTGNTAEAHDAHRLVAAELVKLAIDHRAFVKALKPSPAPEPEVTTAPVEG